MIDNIKIPQNHLLVKVDCLRHKKIAFESGTKIIVDPSFKPEQHANTNGVVVAVPKSLYFNKRDVMESSQYLTDIEVKLGDKVYFHYLQINYAIKHRKVVEVGGEFYIFIRYDSLFCGLRDGKMIMFNGWMLLEPIHLIETDKDKGFVSKLPKDRQKPDPMKGKIVCAGGAVREYFYGSETDNGIEVEEGDEVIFLPHSDIPLEYNMHQDLKKKYFRVQRKELLSVYIN